MYRFNYLLLLVYFGLHGTGGAASKDQTVQFLEKYFAAAGVVEETLNADVAHKYKFSYDDKKKEVSIVDTQTWRYPNEPSSDVQHNYVIPLSKIDVGRIRAEGDSRSETSANVMVYSIGSERVLTLETFGVKERFYEISEVGLGPLQASIAGRLAEGLKQLAQLEGNDSGLFSGTVVAPSKKNAPTPTPSVTRSPVRSRCSSCGGDGEVVCNWSTERTVKSVYLRKDVTTGWACNGGKITMTGYKSKIDWGRNEGDECPGCNGRGHKPCSQCGGQGWYMK